MNINFFNTKSKKVKLDLESEKKAYEIYSQWCSVRDNRIEWIRSVLRDEKFVEGKQLSDEEIKTLENRSQPTVITNLLFPSIQSALTHLLSKNPSFTWTSPNKDDDLSYLNNVLFHIFNESQFLHLTKKCAYSALVKARGGVLVDEDKEADDGFGEVIIDLVNVRDIYIPRHRKRWDLKDLKYLFISKLITTDDAMDNYGLSEEDVEKAIIGYDEYYMDDVDAHYDNKGNAYFMGFDNDGNILEDEDLDYVREIKKYSIVKKDIATIYIVQSDFRIIYPGKIDSVNGSEIIWGKVNENVKDIEELQRNIQLVVDRDYKSGFDIKVINTKRNVIKREIIVGQNIYIEEKYLPTDKYPLILLEYFDTESAYPLSFIQFVTGQQIIYNKANSLMLYSAQQDAFTRLLGPEGCFGKNDAEREQFEQNYSIPGSANEYRLEKIHGVGPIVIKPNPINSAFLTIKEDAKAKIEFITGEYPMRQGDPQNAPETYRATVFLNEQSDTRTRDFGESLDNFFTRVAEVVYNYAKAIYTHPKRISVVIGNNSGDKEDVTINEMVEINGEVVNKNNLFLSNAKPIARPGSYAPAQKFIILQILNTMLERGYPVGDLIVKYLELPDNEKKIIEERIAQQTDVKQLQEALQTSQKDVGKLSGQVTNLMREIEVWKTKAQLAVIKAKAQSESNKKKESGKK